MIIWSGRGVLLAPIFILSMVFLEEVLPYQHRDYSTVISLFLTGLFAWYFGKKWNNEEGRILIDKATGEEVILESNHSLFWIKMHYWGPIAGALGLIFLIKILGGF